MIEPVEVERDELGYWWHPALPEDVDEDFDIDKFVTEQGMETALIELDLDDPLQVSKIAFLEGIADVSNWEPNVPTGEDWFLIAIFDSEAGPYAYYARPRPTSSLN